MQGLLPRVSNKTLAGCANLQMPPRRYLALSIVPFIRNIDLSQGSWLQTEKDNADLSRISIIQHCDLESRKFCSAHASRAQKTDRTEDSCACPPCQFNVRETKRSDNALSESVLLRS